MSTETTTDSNASRYLSFTLGTEDYAIPLLSVREVIAIPEITPIPSTPAHFLGIMNLRGQVISIIDLRQKLGIKPVNSADSAVIICDLSPLCIGVVVDSINSVLSPNDSEIAEKPEIQSSRNTDYIKGVFRSNNKLVLLLDVAKALSIEDIRTAAKTAQADKKAA
jgi:purine-binding chemotaxis protein CheW